MPVPVLIDVLTALAVVVVVVTWLLLRRGDARGPEVGRRLRRTHTVCGVLGAVVWTAFLVAPADTLIGSATTGIIGLGLWWVVAVAGLAMLPRWLPSRGRRAAVHAGRRGRGVALSLLAHVGMVAIVVVFTYAYVTAAV